MNCKSCYWNGKCDIRNMELVCADCCYQDECSGSCYDLTCHYYYPIGLDEQLDYDERLHNDFVAKDESDLHNIGMSVYPNVYGLAATEAHENKCAQRLYPFY